MKRKYIVQIFKLTRMSIVIAVLPSFFIGTLFALIIGNSFILDRFLWGFFILFFIEIAASFANDYFDYEADKNNKQFGFSGGSGVLIEYPELLPFAKWGAVILFLLAQLFTVIFVFYYGFPLWVNGYIAIAIFFCWFYTAPPIKLVYRGLGELPHFLAGIMFPGWGYLLLHGSLDIPFIIFSIPFGLFGLTVILNFEIPDREADIAGGKRNLIVVKGRKFTFFIIMILHIISSLYFLTLATISWLNDNINFWILTLISLIPVLLSLFAVITYQNKKHITTKFAIRNTAAAFISTFFIMGYLFCSLLG